jgi:hypothetical protein
VKKKNRKQANLFAPRSFGNDFLRGALVAGTVEAFARHDPPRFTRKTARTALQGGAVLAAAALAANALGTGRYLTAALATAGAVASISLLKQALPDDADGSDAEESAAADAVS